MEEVIKKAIEGGWKPEVIHTYEQKLTTRIYLMGDVYDLPLASIFLDPLFWQALEESRKPYEDSFGMGDWKKLALKFHEINLTQGWDKAVEYLLTLIK